MAKISHKTEKHKAKNRAKKAVDGPSGPSSVPLYIFVLISRRSLKIYKHLLFFCYLNRTFDLFDHIFNGLTNFSAPNFRSYFFRPSIHILMYWYAIGNYKLYGKFFDFIPCFGYFHTLLPELLYLHQTFTFWYVNMSNVTAGYGMFSESIAFFVNFHTLNTCLKRYNFIKIYKLFVKKCRHKK